MTEQTQQLIESLPGFADVLKAADPRGSSEWEVVRWKGTDPRKVQPEQVEVVTGLTFNGEPVANRFPNRTAALEFSANWVRRYTKQYTERGHTCVWRWQEGDKVMFQTVLPIIRHNQAVPGIPEGRNTTPSTMVRLSEDAYRTVRRLAQEESKSLQALLDDAIREYDRLQFFAKANAAYKALRRDPEAWKEELEERAAWDVTLVDDLDRGDTWHEQSITRQTTAERKRD